MRTLCCVCLHRRNNWNRKWHRLSLEIKPVASASVGDLEEQFVLALGQAHSNFVLIRRNSSGDFFIGDQLAVEPKFKAVIGTKRKLQFPCCAGLDRAVKIGRTVSSAQIVHLSVHEIFGELPLQLAVSFSQIDIRFVNERLGVSLVEVTRTKGPNMIPRGKCRTLSQRLLLGGFPLRLPLREINLVRLLLNYRRDAFYKNIQIRLSQLNHKLSSFAIDLDRFVLFDNFFLIHLRRLEVGGVPIFQEIALVTEGGLDEFGNRAILDKDRIKEQQRLAEHLQASGVIFVEHEQTVFLGIGRSS